MPIISKIGRKTPKIRIVIFLMYALLIAGGATMVYPFLIMLSGSVKGMADMDVFDVVPKFLYSERMKFARFEENRYSGVPSNLPYIYYRDFMNRFDQVEIPRETHPQDLEKYRRFLSSQASNFPLYFFVPASNNASFRMLGRNFRKLRESLITECGGSVEEFDRKYKQTFTNWNDFMGFYDNPFQKEFVYDRKDPLMHRYLQFKRSLALSENVPQNADGVYYTAQRDFPEIKSGKAQRSKILSDSLPRGEEGEVWAKFVQGYLNPLFIRLDADGLKLFREFLSAKFPKGVDQMNGILETKYRSFEDIRIDDDVLTNCALCLLYTAFIKQCPPEHLRVDTICTRYRRYAGSKDALLPLAAFDYSLFKAQAKPAVWEMLSQNYISVFQYVGLYGRAIFNTLIFIGLSILAALLVNPLAAYALSRFNLKHTYTILLFFISTMAFPAAVTMIPNFLLLKELHMLNTFWALVLPGIANGYSIFILKGFFDSIPRDVYESALLDGAGEWTLFWRFTMALSKPILALMTLGAFTGAYTAFMFALIICPDDRMWTLMVWLYQLQLTGAQPVIYAGLVLAAIPTLLIFVFCQNTIMKGIVIPVEK